MLVHDFPCHGGLFSCHDMLVHECSCHVVPFQDMLVHDFSYHGDSSFQSCTCWFMNVPCHVVPFHDMLVHDLFMAWQFFPCTC